MVYSGWKFILFLVFCRMTSNFICLTFSTIRSSSLWRIVTIFLLLEKAVIPREPQVRPREPLLLLMRFAKLNRPPSLLRPPPPPTSSEKNKPPGGLIEDLRYAKRHRSLQPWQVTASCSTVFISEASSEMETLLSPLPTSTSRTTVFVRVWPFTFYEEV